MCAIQRIISPPPHSADYENRPAVSCDDRVPDQLPAGDRFRDGAVSVRLRSLTEGNGFPLRRSYRSARRNQNASPPVLWYAPGVGVRGETLARTPSEPFLPVLFQPRDSIIMRTTTPTACRNRLVRRGC